MTDVINCKWTFDFVKKPEEDLLQWHIRLIKYITRFCEQPDSIANEFLYPKYTLKYLPLFWKYHHCGYPQQHEHAQKMDLNSKQVWLDCTNIQPKAKNLWREMEVDDKFKIWSLRVNNLLLFPNPNIDIKTLREDDTNIWEWNIIVSNHKTQSPLSHPVLIDLFQCLKDPYEPIWAGRKNYMSNDCNTFVIPIQFNSDAFEFVKIQVRFMVNEVSRKFCGCVESCFIIKPI